MVFKWDKLVDKYKLKQVTKDGQRYYSYGDAKYYSITRILGWESKEGIEKWRESIGAEAANKISRESLPLGTRMHKYCEEYLNNDPLTEYDQSKYVVSPLKMFEQIKPLLDENVSTVRATEFRLHSNFPLYTAGTADLIFMDNNNNLAIGDFKSCMDLEKKRPFMDGYYKQLCFYSKALLNTYNMNALTGYIFMCDRNMNCEIFKVNVDDYYADLEVVVLNHRDWLENEQKKEQVN